MEKFGTILWAIKTARKLTDNALAESKTNKYLRGKRMFADLNKVANGRGYWLGRYGKQTLIYCYKIQVEFNHGRKIKRLIQLALR